MKNIFILVLALFLCSCGPFKKQHVGETLPSYHPSVCRCSFKPTECEITTQHFKFTFTIKETSMPDEYIAEGTAQNLMGGGADTLFGGSRFFLLLANEGVVIDNLTWFTKGNEPTSKGILLKRKFTSSSFDAVAIGYDVKLHD